jgi:DNA-binding XRE family transcriptional regulator
MQLKELRLRGGMTQRELGQKAGVAEVTIGAIERGVELPTMRTARRLAEALEVELTDIDEVKEAIARALKKDPTGNSPVGVSSLR